MNPVQNILPPYPIGVYTVVTATLVNKEGYLVKLDGDGKVLVPADPADIVIGVVENGADVGGNCDVRYLGGILRVKVGASAISAGDRVYSNTGGAVLPATGAASDVYRSVGVALADAAAGGFVAILCQPETVSV